MWSIWVFIRHKWFHFFIKYLSCLVNHIWLKILRVVLVRSLFIVHLTNSPNSPIDWVAYSFLMHSTKFINSGLSTISSLSYTYMMTITVPSSFSMYNIQGPLLHYLNHALRVIVLMYSSDHQRSACTISQIYYISVNIYLYVLYSSSISDIPSSIFM